VACIASVFERPMKTFRKKSVRRIGELHVESVDLRYRFRAIDLDFFFCKKCIDEVCFIQKKGIIVNRE